MSTDSGIAAVVGAVVGQTQAELAASRAAADGAQLDLLEPTPEEMLFARLELGDEASGLAIVQRARRNRGGRPLNARNKRTDDFARYILSFGQDPAITLIQIASTPAELLIENSRRKVRKLVKGGKGKPDEVVEFTEQMSYEAAQSLRKQCAAELMPFVHAKRPIAVDMNFSGVRDLVIEGVTHSQGEVRAYIDGDYVEVPDEEHVA